jgi:hypothetical protein
MCVLLCANPKVHEWVDLPAALADRKMRQHFAQCLAQPTGALSACPGTATDWIAPPEVAHRRAWLQLFCRRMANARQGAMERPTSSQDGHPFFEAIANAWGRLLSFIGLRR